jgi:hypothetical protein
MPQTAKPRRLIDLPGIRELEGKALMNPRYADADARAHFSEIDAVSRAIFGLTADEADNTPRPDGWDRIERKPLREQIVAFEAAGWDVTDDRRRPLRMLEHFTVQLWLAARGVAGTLPEVIEQESDHGAAALLADVKRFQRDRR